MENKINEEGFDFVDYAIQEMKSFFEMRVENLEPNEDK